MAQVFKIAKAFQSTDRNTKQPEVVPTQGGDMHKWMFQVEGQTQPGWMQMLKKPENALAVGDEVYGIIDTWDNGNAKFVKQDRPQGATVPQTGGPVPVPAQVARPASVATASTGGLEELNEKVDFVITLLENFLESQGGTVPARETKTNEGLDGDGPIDLSEIPY